MKFKATLVILFLFAFGSGISGAAVHENRRPSYYYGPAPYEYDNPGEHQARYLEYMPREFRIPEESRNMPSELGDQGSEFMTYEEAIVRYSGELPPQQNAIPAAHADYFEITDLDGFIPYEYARERYAAPQDRQ